VIATVLMYATALSIIVLVVPAYFYYQQAVKTDRNLAHVLLALGFVLGAEFLLLASNEPDLPVVVVNLLGMGAMIALIARFRNG
jgi:hypothetical protein